MLKQEDLVDWLRTSAAWLADPTAESMPRILSPTKCWFLCSLFSMPRLVVKNILPQISHGTTFSPRFGASFASASPRIEMAWP